MAEIIQATVKTLKRSLLLNYVYWHFMEMPETLLKVWWNLIFLALHKFSVVMHFKTLLSPFRKYRFRSENTKADIADMIFGWFGALVMNIFSRLMGIFFRLTLIILGLGLAIVMFVAGGIVFLSWFVIPILAMLAIIKGMTLL
jgi:hypothetical protein